MHSILIFFSSLTLLQTSAHASVYQKETLWDKTKIKVCFAPVKALRYTEFAPNLKYVAQAEALGCAPTSLQQFPKEKKSLIQKIITETYRADTTVIEFVGWDECPTTREALSAYDAMIVTQTLGKNPSNDQLSKCGSVSLAGLYAHGTIGNIAKVQPGVLPVVILGQRDINRTSVLSEVQSTRIRVTHEFGHLAGLRHEHVRWDDTRTDPVCKRVEREVQPLYQEPVLDASFEGNYDASSVMNYCHDLFMSDLASEVHPEDLTLSTQDQELLKQLYTH